MSQRNPQERFFVRDPDEIHFSDGADEGPESAAELALRRHERLLGRSLAKLTAAQEAYAAARKTKDRDPERWRQARSDLERAKVAHARLRKTHRRLQQAHQAEHDKQEEDSEAEFAFGLPTSYEEGKHPRGYGGKWAEKPRTFDAIQDERLQGENRALLASLTPAESAALKGYTLTDYRHLNSPLWHGKPLAPAQVKQVGHLDAIFARQKPLEQSVRCWRGFSADEKRTKEVLAQMKKAQKAGTVVEWPGYTSTSIHPGLGRAFGTVRFEIQVRHGVYLEGFSGIRGEHEMLLPRGSRFRVLGVQKVQLTPSSKPETVIQLEQL